MSIAKGNVVRRIRVSAILEQWREYLACDGEIVIRLSRDRASVAFGGRARTAPTLDEALTAAADFVEST